MTEFKRKLNYDNTIEDLKPGDVFIYSKVPYMKAKATDWHIHFYADAEDRFGDEIQRNDTLAVNLLTGEVVDAYTFGNCIQVIDIKIEEV